MMQRYRDGFDYYTEEGQRAHSSYLWAKEEKKLLAKEKAANKIARKKKVLHFLKHGPSLPKWLEPLDLGFTCWLLIAILVSAFYLAWQIFHHSHSVSFFLTKLYGGS